MGRSGCWVALGREGTRRIWRKGLERVPRGMAVRLVAVNEGVMMSYYVPGFKIAYF